MAGSPGRESERRPEQLLDLSAGQCNLLFSYYERTGADRPGGAERIAVNPVMQDWLRLCRSYQVQLVPGEGPRLWADMERIFHQP